MNSLRFRLFISFVIIAMVALFGVAIFAIQGAQRLVQDFVGRGGLLGAENLVNELEQYYQENQSWQGAESLFFSRGQGEGRGRGGGNLGLVDGQGVLLFPPNTSVSPEILQSLVDGGVSLVVDGEKVGTLVHLVESAINSQEFSQSMVNLITRAALNAALIAGVISLLLALAGSYLLERPVSELIKVVESIAHGDLTRRVEVKNPQELKRLGDSFNDMAASLQRAEQNRRAMTADIAHELRNPLAVQRANLEAIQDGIFPLTRASLEPVLEQNRLLNRLVEDLRTLALADAGELSLVRRPTDLRNLIQGALERFNVDIAGKNISLNHKLPHDLPLVNIDPERIVQILHNLLQNAIRYTPQAGVIDVALSVDGPWVEVSVHDSGPGIPPHSLPHLFERFYRDDPGRGREDGTTGLGLSIARKLAEAHAGTLTARNHPQGGALFVLRLPMGIKDSASG
jgi:signal transduction histidine kinase